MEKEWVVDVNEKCALSQIPFFFKQWGGTLKKNAGCLLEGKEFKFIPAL